MNAVDGGSHVATEREVDSSLPGSDERYDEAMALERARVKARSRLNRRGQAQVALATVGLIVAWELLVPWLGVPRFILPTPSEILNALISRGGLLWDHTLQTMLEVVGGYALSIVVGIPLAVALTYYRSLGQLVYPLLVSAQAVPKVAIAPLFVIWFGFGILPKILIAFSIAFFPIVIGTVVGLRAITPEMLNLGRSMGASTLQIYLHFRLPAALPAIFGGLKLAVSLAVVGAIVGEFVGANRGLGYIVQIAQGQLQTDLVFAAIAVMSLMGIVLFYLVAVIESRVLSWHASARLEQIQASM